MEYTHNSSPPRIAILPERVYQRIAAGEVIDRPASVLRELIDNSIDAGSRTIEVYISKGGNEEIRVVDDGTGIEAEDLEIAILPHATSKVTRAEDLQSITSLGFRGEALSSIAASSRLEITSKPPGSAVDAHKIFVESGKLRSSGTSKGRTGTTVSVRDLFYSLPARKQFLKQPSTEQKMCRQIFIEKALPFTDIFFRLYSDGSEQLSLPPSSLLERGKNCFSRLLNPAGLIENSYSEADGFSIRCLLGYPQFFRRDRRFIYIYINNRRIDEYGLVQAVEYGYGDYLPKGRFPYAFVFITLSPDTVDFNIHPAKREVRLNNLSSVHRALHRFVRSTLLEHTGPENTAVPSSESVSTYRGNTAETKQLPGFDTVPQFPSVAEARRQFEAFESEQHDRSNTGNTTGGATPSGEIHFIGQVFSLFLVASVGETMYIIDQHAAHERYLFDLLNVLPPHSQPLLVPLAFETDSDTGDFLRSSLDTYRRLGIGVHEEGKNHWQLTEVPEAAGISGEVIIDFLTSAHGDEQHLRKELFARVACHSSIQDGERLDNASAVDLIKKALALPVPRCPHGRPVWHTISRDRLFSLVGRRV